MRKAEQWKNLLKVESAFLTLEDKIRAGVLAQYQQIHPEAFAWHGWDLISEERLFQMMVPFLRQQIRRARRTMPGIYGHRLDDIDPDEICTMEDWQRLPVLMKDADPEQGGSGFREAAMADPRLMKPTDLQVPVMTFLSGGTSGKASPTFVTSTDRAREIQAWRRGHAYHGLMPGDTALYTYNTTHKGGQWMQESLLLHGVTTLLRRPEEDPEAVLENLRDYGVNILFTVQQPVEVIESQTKAAGINLHTLVMASLENPQYRGLLVPDRAGNRQVDFIFLGGFEIVPYALELAQEYLGNAPVATLLGSSEAIPQACSTNPTLTPGGLCHFNNLHLLQAPHYLEVAAYQDGQWRPVRKGEEGVLLYTSWARDGTIWIRYAPGDLATKLLDENECPCGLYSPVIGSVRRANPKERADLFVSGCAAG
jgi:phenylacetate-CoA ligase